MDTLDLLSARQAAESAAHASAVNVREVTGLDEMSQVVALFNSIWGQARPAVSVELLRALEKAGNYVGGAFEGTKLVGACVGFFHAPSDRALHSHVAGVAREMSGRNAGFALKQHQRAWALERDVAEIVWTFDPLVARNAYFNLAKLGARAVEYLPNFYGSMLDEINGDDDSDRLLVSWSLGDPVVASAARGVAVGVSKEGAVVALGRDEAGRPEPGPAEGDLCLVAVPTDVHHLRRSDPKLAVQWRTAVRETLGDMLGHGARVIGFDRDSGYLVDRSGGRSGSQPERMDA